MVCGSRGEGVFESSETDYGFSTMCHGRYGNKIKISQCGKDRVHASMFGSVSEASGATGNVYVSIFTIHGPLLILLET